jgi:hypothetical protein
LVAARPETKTGTCFNRVFGRFSAWHAWGVKKQKKIFYPKNSKTSTHKSGEVGRRTAAPELRFVLSLITGERGLYALPIFFLGGGTETEKNL